MIKRSLQIYRVLIVNVTECLLNIGLNLADIHILMPEEAETAQILGVNIIWLVK